MDVASNILAFVRVVEMGSISAASRSSRQTPSAVSKQISHLEDHVGHRLLYRTRTGVSLTDEGRAYYDICKGMAAKYAEAEEHITSLSGHPRGKLRVACSVAFGKSQLIPNLGAFLDQYPDIRVSLELTDRQINIEEENFDASINFAEQVTNPNVVARMVMRNERVLCAAPSFLSRYGSPRDFDDLDNFNCLRTSTAVDRNAWSMLSDETPHRVDADGNFAGNSADVVFQAALAGIGIARLSTYIVADSIASGRLVRLFPEYSQKHADIIVAFAAKRNLVPKTRVFVDFLVQRFQHGPQGQGQPPVAPSDRDIGQ